MDERPRRRWERGSVSAGKRTRRRWRQATAETFEIVCECANTDCMEHLWVTTELYERARREPTDFLLKPGHAKLEFETVIEGHEEFELVRKIGATASVARQLGRRS